MIKNSPTGRRWVLLAAALPLFAAACETTQAKDHDALQGVVQYDDRIIGFELGGRVLDVAVERGQQATQGQLLARLDDALELPERDLRAADLAAAQAQLRLLRAGTRHEELAASASEIEALRATEDTQAKNLARQQQLQVAGAATAQSIDEMSSQLRATSERRRALEERLKAARIGARVEEISAAQARAQAANAALAAVDARLARYALMCPADGTVVDVHVKTGEMVAPGSPAVTVADLSHPFVDVFAPEGKMGGIAVSAPTTLRVDGVASEFGGRIEHVFPRAEFTPRFLFSEGERPNLVIRVRVRIDDPRHLLHEGVPAFVRLAGNGG
jgi:HlyD family secretion protein